MSCFVRVMERCIFQLLMTLAWPTVDVEHKSGNSG